jgi:two-component system KDP operon response regulator KdpE
MHHSDASSAREAIAKAENEVPDLVLADLGLPDGDAMEFVRFIRGRSGVPIVVLTARSQEPRHDRSTHAGAND